MYSRHGPGVQEDYATRIKCTVDVLTVLLSVSEQMLSTNYLNQCQTAGENTSWKLR
jgi:hypothetical protein